MMFLVWVGLHISLTSAFLRPSSPLPRKLAQGRGISPLSRPVLLQDAVADVELQPSRPQDEEEEQDPRTLEEIRAENNQTLAELRQLVDRLEQKVPVEEKAARSNVKKMYDNTGNEEDVLDTVREFQRASQSVKFSFPSPSETAFRRFRFTPQKIPILQFQPQCCPPTISLHHSPVCFPRAVFGPCPYFPTLFFSRMNFLALHV